MVNLNQPLPGYLTTRPNIIRLVVFTALFALVFINIYAPFGVETWYSVTRLELFFYSSLVILTGVLVVVASRVMMFFIAKKYRLTVFQYLMWVLGEVLMMALFYTLYEKLILTDSRPIELMLKNSVQNTALVLMLPYSVLWLYFSYVDKKNQIEALTDTGPRQPDSRNAMIGFYDEKDVMQLSLKINDLLFIEASSNYVTIVYLKKDKLTRFLLRNTMKKLESLMSDYGIVRCHRSYMVNFDKVKLMRKDRNGLVLEMEGNESVEVPVSKTYVESIMTIFGRYASV